MYENFEHKADIGVRGKASSVEEAFAEAAKALFNVEVDVKKVKPSKKIKFKCSAMNLEELFVEWLNSLLSHASLRDMVFSKFKVKIKNTKPPVLEGEAFGEKFNAKKHNVKSEVKGATYSQLKVYQDKGLWIAQCIVDV